MSSLAAALDPTGIELEWARRKLIAFTQQTFPAYRANWHHEVLADALDQFIDGPITRLLVFLPPRYGKSELVSRRLPALILGRNPDARIISCSYGAKLASRNNRDVQRIIDDARYAELFPDTRLFGKNIRTVAQGTFLRNNDIFEIIGHRGYYISAGIGGAITGMGADYALIDDPIKNRLEANSETFRDNIWEWYTSTLYTRLEENARVLVTMTRWHEDDLAGRLLQQMSADPEADQWTVIRFPAIKDEPDIPYDPREPGEALWPDKYPVARLATIKATVGSSEWEAVFQQRPAPAEGGMLKRGWWQFYRTPPARFDEVIQSWDMSFKDTKSSDFVVGQVWGRRGAEKFLLDQVRARMDFPTAAQAVVLLSAKWPEARAKLIEGKANGPAVIAYLTKRIPGLIEVEPLGGKIARAAAVSPTVEAGNVYLPDPSRAPWVGDFITECAQFPNGAFDDQVDAMSQALTRLESSAISAAQFGSGGTSQAGGMSW